MKDPNPWLGLTWLSVFGRSSISRYALHVPFFEEFCRASQLTELQPKLQTQRIKYNGVFFSFKKNIKVNITHWERFNLCFRGIYFWLRFGLMDLVNNWLGLKICVVVQESSALNAYQLNWICHTKSQSDLYCI